MARTRDPGRLDEIVAAAAWAFSHLGYARAKISQVADRARIGPGTVYLYVEDKDALFELAVLRALESPEVAHPALPYRKSPPASQAKLLEQCLHQVAHFPQLWVAAQHRNVTESVAEFDGILLEICTWLRRYRSAILLAERNRFDWPDLAAMFDEVVWSDLHQRLTGYLGVRTRAAHLRPVGDPAAVARFLIDALVAAIVSGPIGVATEGTRHFGDDELLVRLAGAALRGSGDPLPLPAKSGHYPA